jgi:ComF family protein
VTKHTATLEPGPPATVWVNSLRDAVIDLLFPPHCAICGTYGAWLCTKCWERIDTFEAPTCHRCGRPVGADQASECPRPGRCVHNDKEHPIDGFVACGYHEGVLRQAVLTFKYDGLQVLARPLGHLMAAAWSHLAPARVQGVDGIVAVPLHPRRQRQRGFCQATLLARELATRFQVPLIRGSLIRTKHTVPQVGLSASERQSNVQGAFRCTDSAPTGKRLLVIDDVYTTGSTLESVCTALRQAGSQSVWALTVGRARS